MIAMLHGANKYELEFRMFKQDAVGQHQLEFGFTFITTTTNSTEILHIKVLFVTSELGMTKPVSVDL